MKIIKYFLVVLLNIAFISPVIAAPCECPAPNQILVIPLPTQDFPGYFLWIAYMPSVGVFRGLGGSVVGNFIGGVSGTFCFYSSNAHATPEEIYKKINLLPPQARSAVRYLRGTTDGFMIGTNNSH